ncbi:DUF6287 domain-containing protein [Fructobacillus ficulneus]|uniref:DUF6287 domain-containing protein n=1 Tax=Fructobacillus ficulneus TaxID=157463 RepID=A0A0K8MJ77_9LACO|nr:DUF6287 domain-containing protein [Fructobacillus ficulneus]GAP00498.1 hypothetical protein FFIC_285170 [Fructobacillus ficulneus]
MLKRKSIFTIATVAVIAAGTGTYVMGSQLGSHHEDKDKTSVQITSKKMAATESSSTSAVPNTGASSQASSTMASSSSSSAAPAQPVTKAMDINAIKNGDYSSVVGTWQNPDGNKLVFDKNGLVSTTFGGTTATDYTVYVNQTQHLPAATIQDGMLKAYLGPKDENLEEASSVDQFYFIPKGVNMTGTSDNSHDRIYTGQSYEDDNIFQKVN